MTLYAFADNYSAETAYLGALDTPGEVDDFEFPIMEEPEETITERDFDTETEEALIADEAEWLIEQLWSEYGE